MSYPTVQHYFIQCRQNLMPNYRTLFCVQRQNAQYPMPIRDVLFEVQHPADEYPMPVRNQLFTLSQIADDNSYDNYYEVPVYTLPQNLQTQNTKQPYPVFVFPTIYDNFVNNANLRANAVDTALDIYYKRHSGLPKMQIDVDSSVDAILNDERTAYNEGLDTLRLLSFNNANNINNTQNLQAEIVDLRNVYQAFINGVNRYFNSIPR